MCTEYVLGNSNIWTGVSQPYIAIEYDPSHHICMYQASEVLACYNAFKINVVSTVFLSACILYERLVSKLLWP